MENCSKYACVVEASALKTYWKSPVATGLFLLLLFMLSAKNSIAQEERLTTSFLLVARLHLPHEIEVRLHVH